MITVNALSEVAALMGDPARASMLQLLMDGRAHTASDLAHAAGVTAQTASGHLGRMVEANLLAARAQGRNRFYRLASGEGQAFGRARLDRSAEVAAKGPST